MTTEPSAFPSRRFRFRAALLLFCASFLMALPALRGGLLNYDDQDLIHGGHGEPGIVHRTSGSLLTSTYFRAYLPVYGLSYKLDTWLCGDDPLAYHAGNVFWNAVAGFAAFLVLATLLENGIAALIGALLFLLHPLHVESVAWIAGRKELVSGFFFFLAWLFFLRGEEGKRGAMAAAMGAFLVACFAKASAVVLPGVLLAAAWLLPRYRGRRGEAARRTVPLFLVAILPVAVHLWFGIHAGVAHAPAHLGERILWGFAAMGDAARKTLLPFGLSVDYPDARVASAGAALVPLLFFAGALAAVFFLRKRAPAAAFGIALFWVALSPFNGIFPATDTLRADRYLYLPVFGAAFVGAWACTRAWAMRPVLGAVAGLLCILSFSSSYRFRSSEALWTATIASNDDSALAYYDRGQVRFEAATTHGPLDTAMLDSAIRDMESGAQRARLPEMRITAEAGLVTALTRRGELGKALEHAENALRLLKGDKRPEAKNFKAELLRNRAAIETGLHRLQDAARDYQAAADLHPTYTTLLELGKTLNNLRRLGEAVDRFRQAGHLEPDAIEPPLAIATIYQSLGSRSEQRDALESASDRRPDAPEVVAAWINYWLGGDSPDYTKAEKALDKLPEGSVARRRLSSQVQAQRALYFFRRGGPRNEKEAVAAARAALAAGGEIPPRTLYELGNVFLDSGNLGHDEFDLAIQCFQKSSDVLADRPVYRDAIARAYALKAYALWLAGRTAEAADAMRTGLAVGPEVVQAGFAPLRGEIAGVAESSVDAVQLLAVATVVGDPDRGEKVAATLLQGKASRETRVLVYRLRALLREYASRDFDGAEADLKEVLTDVPKDRWAELRLAQVYTSAGVAWVQTAQRIDSPGRKKQGEALLKKARDLLNALLEAHPAFAPASLARGEVAFAQGDITQAKADYQRARRELPGRTQVYVKEAELHRLLYVETNDIENLHSAKTILKQALAIDPNDFEALYELGNVEQLYYDRRDQSGEDRARAMNDAAKWYRRAMSLNPRAKAPRVEWGQLVLKAEKEAEAQSDLTRAAQLVALVEKDAPDLAPAYETEIRLKVRDDYVRRTREKFDDVFKEIEAALAHLRKLAPKDPALPELEFLYHRRKGWAYYLTWVRLAGEPKGMPKEQAAQRAKARTEAKDLVVKEWRAALDQAPEENDDTQDLRTRLRQLAPGEIGYDKDLAKREFLLGKKAMDAHDWVAAAGHLGKVVALFPEWDAARFAYGRALSLEGKLDEARKQLERLANRKDGPTIPEVCLELGNIYNVMREKETAKVWYRRFIAEMEKRNRSKEPSVAEARHLLATLG